MRANQRLRAALTVSLVLTLVAGQIRAAEDEPYVMLEAPELQKLVAPVALYPDDLLSIVLPASTYPLQIVQAARFLEERAAGDAPDEDWDETVVALTNYPEALALLNDDLNWTWRLGEAVLYQESELLKAVADYRKLAKDAGNLETDDHQVVALEGEHITIKPASEREIYVPYYDAEDATRTRTTRVIHYYPTAYPLYYYPYNSSWAFPSDYFWGVTTWYGIGWSGWRLHNLFHSYRYHPYYRQSYRHHHYRAPRYSRRHPHRAHRYHNGNAWRPHHRRHGARPGDRRARRHYDSLPPRVRQARPGRQNREIRQARRMQREGELRRRTHSPGGGNRVGRRQNEVNAAVARSRINSRVSNRPPARGASNHNRRATNRDRRTTNHDRRRVRANNRVQNRPAQQNRARNAPRAGSSLPPVRPRAAAPRRSQPAPPRTGTRREQRPRQVR